MTSRFSREYAATLAKTQEEARAAKRQPPEWTTGGNCEFVDITGMGVSRVPVPPRAVASTPAVVSSLSNGTSNGPTHNKFRNVPTNGYHSKREAKRALDLSLMLVAGQVRNLRAQVKYLLIPKQDGERECSYVADFVYEERGFVTDFGTIWNSIVEDCKGFRTPDYIIKRKLMLFVHGVKVRET